MAGGFGTKPSFDALKIGNPLVRGFVNSAYRYALGQPVPSGAVKDFSDDLCIEPSAFEKRYGVPASRLKHQLRGRDADAVAKEARSQLRSLAEDFSNAESLWGGMFDQVIDRYFKGRDGRIREALKGSRWYPFLRLSEEKGMDHLSRRENCRVCFMPTDRKQKKRVERLASSVLGSQHGFGWLYIIEDFRSVDGTEGLVIEKMQRPAIRGSPRIEIPQLPESVVVFIQECGTDDAQLLMHLMALHNCVGRVNSGDAHALQEVIETYRVVVQGLRVSGSNELCEALRAWWLKVRKVVEVVRRCSPQPFYRLDFLPAFLANIHLMGLDHPDLMEKAMGVFIDTSRVSAGSTVLSEVPKEKGDYVKLLDALDAAAVSKDLYFVRFGR